MAAPLNTSANDTALEEALRLARHGLRVLPIKPGHKRPPMTAWQDAATSDQEVIRSWFTGLYRNHGVGVATGYLERHGKHLFVVDVDEHDPAMSGSETLADLETLHGPLPDTLEVQTGSGGRHLYYLAPVAYSTPRVNTNVTAGQFAKAQIAALRGVRQLGLMYG